MIPITDYTVTAIAALVYNSAYEQSAGEGWEPDGGEPGDSHLWRTWTGNVLAVLQEQPEATDEQVLEEAKKRTDTTMKHNWSLIRLWETEEGDKYSDMVEETGNVLNLIRDFLVRPCGYVEGEFLDEDPEYLAYMEMPIASE